MIIIITYDSKQNNFKLYSNTKDAYGTKKGGTSSAPFEIILCPIFWGEKSRIFVDLENIMRVMVRLVIFFSNIPTLT